MTTIFHIFRYPLDIGRRTVAYYKIHSTGYGNVKGNARSFFEIQGIKPAYHLTYPSVLRLGGYYRPSKVNSDPKLGH